MLIGIVGKMGSGKDYITNNYILPKLGYDKCHIISMADQLKVEVMIQFNIPFEKLYIKKDKDSRNLLQTFGTDIERRRRGQDIWFRYVDAWIKVYQYRGKKYFIIPDIRFENEAEFIKSNGGILIKIEAEDRTKERQTNEMCNTQHISEIQVDKIKCDYTLNNSKSNIENVTKDFEIIFQDFCKIHN